MLEKGTTLAGYRIDGILGQGGMGVVYEATQLTLNRTVALKLLASHLSDDIAFRERFRREGQIQAAMDHPNIITVHEAGETEEGLFLAMRLIRGPNLKEMIVARELDAGRTIRILKPVAEALDDAHGAGLIHRDVKPQNILVGARDHPYLADFGLTKGPAEKSLTRTGQFVGTLDYIAPEQIQGKRASAQSDIYSLTAVFHECLTGVVPFPRESEAAVLYAHLSDPPPRVTDERPELPAGLDEVISKGMAKDPDERPASCLELVEEAERTFTKRSRATMSPPGPIETPQQTGIREAEADIPTRESRSPALPPAETRAADSDVEAVNAFAETRAAGETRAATEPSMGAASAPTFPQRTGLAPGQLAAAGVALVVLAVAGFLIGSSGGDSNTGSLPSSASAGALQIGFPGDWNRTRDNPPIPGIEFEDPIRFGPGDGAGRRLTTGAVDATGPALLPRGFVRRLPGGKPPPRDDTVRLGKLEAYRYANLKPRGFDHDLTLYVSPTSAGTATVACIANRGDGASFGAGCERAASSLELTRGRAYGLGPDDAYARVVDTTISRLNGQVRKDKVKLRSAKTPVGQARAAGGLAGAYAAARRLSRVDVSPATEDIHAAVVASLRRTASDYTRMSRAAGRDARSEYNAARAGARAGERSVGRALVRLRALGYELKRQ